MIERAKIEFCLKFDRKHIKIIAEDLRTTKTKVLVADSRFVYFLNVEETIGGVL
ncbi:MAG: hypothetical protein II878_07110 [Bacteroidales bacterium]|nr:hypothetical protein [Bacteroidales bacterium]